MALALGGIAYDFTGATDPADTRTRTAIALALMCGNLGGLGFFGKALAAT